MKQIQMRFQLLSIVFASSLLAANAQHTPIHIHGDLTDPPRKIYHADVDILVHRSPRDLITPEWILGTLGPDSPIHGDSL